MEWIPFQLRAELILKMNQLQLNLENDIEKKNHFWINLKIDGKEFIESFGKDLNAVVFEELVCSLKKEGEFLIFTCSCGVADCGGWEKVKVTHTSNSIIWDFEYEDIYHFEFDKSSYKTEVELIKNEIKKLGDSIILEPEIIVDPE